MNNRYFEFNVKPQNESKDKTLYLTFKITKFVFILISVVFFYFAFMFDNIFWFYFVITLTITLVLWYFQLKFYNFYDFIFVDGDVSVVKIINNVRRKNLIKFNVKSIVKIGLVRSLSTTYLNDKNIKKIYAFNKLKSNDVYILVDNGEKSILYLPYDEQFMSGVLRYNAYNKLDKDLISMLNDEN